VSHRLVTGVAVLAALVISACAHFHEPAFQLQPCKVDGVAEPLLCGALPVREDRNDRDSRRISLKIVVVPATGEKTQPPLYDLAGGPGIAATASAKFWATDGARYRAHRDVVLVDQRGSGGSNPLDCPVNFYDPFTPVLAPETVGECRVRLSAKADLSQYTTRASVEDLEEVRAALHHEKIDLSGLSYGTRLAQEYLRAHADHVRTMVLLGTLSPIEKLPLSFSANAQAVLDRLAEQCAADARCHKTIEDLAGDLKVLRNTLASGAINVTRKDGRKVPLEPGPFWEGVRRQLASTATQRKLPSLLHRAAYGNFEPILEAMRTTPDPGANGLLLSVNCSEDTPRITAEEIATLSANVFTSYRVQRQIAACRIWNVPLLDTPRNGYVISTVPALLMTGDMDPATPADWAQKVASHLPNSRVVVVPNLGHLPDGLSHMECYDRIIADFFDAGSAKDLDLNCLKSMQPPAFDLPKIADKAPAKKKAAHQASARKKATAKGKPHKKKHHKKHAAHG
jgi:pimeloyl-ACP methyl ester carboxylesterase